MKALRTWTIITLVLSVICLGLVVLCVYRPAEFGEWMVVTYEEITCELGHTATGAYNIISTVSIISFSILFIANQVLHFCYAAKAEKSETVEEANTINTTKEESTVLKKVKAEKKEKVKKERKEKVKKVAKKVIDEVIEQVTETKIQEPVTETKPAEMGANQKLANFLDSFR